MSKSVGTPPLSEKDFQRSVVDYAKLKGWIVFHDFDSRRNSRGLPDLILCKPGRIGTGRLVMAELKSERGRLRPEQKMWVEALSSVLGVEIYVWRPRDMDEIIRILQ